jgi:hypothetical protein
MASLDDIDKRTKIGTPAWLNNHDEDTQRLSAWRRLHALLPHDEIKRLGLKYDDSPVDLVAAVKKIEKILKEN